MSTRLMQCAAAALGVLAWCGAAAANEPAMVWVEGENAVRRNVTRHNWYDSVRRDQLSGDDWISHWNSAQQGEVEYTFEIPRTDRYRFWVRANPTGTRLSYRLDDGDWTPVDFAGAQDRVNIAGDGALDLRFIAWVEVGEFSLRRGIRRVAFHMHSANSNHGAIDCFLFTTDTMFMPQGKLKPGEKSGAAGPGHFAWEPALEWGWTRESAFDLRHLNEARAGQSGFVRREGDRLALGDGTPVKFWMVQGTSLLSMTNRQIDWWARRLARYGVNLVRIEARVSPDWRAQTRAIDRDRLDRIHYVVSALREQGIYVYFGHVYWARETTARLFLCDEMQATYFTWAEALMTTENPYTGVPLAQDPAVAVYEIQNEDSLLFWTFNPVRFPQATRELFERRFGQWLVARYGSLDEARRAWGPDRYPHTIGGYAEAGPDDWANGRVRLYGVAHLTGADWAVSQRNERRARDQLHFMIDSQKQAYETIRRRLVEELGVQSIIACSNWKTADGRVLDALEHYTYTAGDLICRNDYFTPRYDPSPERFYRVEVGDQYYDRSALTMPETVSSLQNQMYADMPYMITENNWERPNRFRMEWPFLVAMYGSLAGVDGWVFFSIGPDPWDSGMNIWAVNDTTVLGQFPVAALIFRRGDVQQAPTVIHEALRREDLYAFEGSAMRAPEGLDELWRQMLGDERRVEGQSPSALDPLAFYVGRVSRRVGENATDGLITDLRPFIDRENKTVRSVTGELLWDFGAGLVTVNTPRAQGAVGFLGKSGRIELDDIVIESGNEYGSVLMVSLDGKPLASSRRILIQAGTEDHTYGFETEQESDGRKRIVSLGGYPLNVRKIDATVTVKRSDLTEAVVLDGNGYPTDRRAGTPAAGALRIRLPEDSLYTLVH